VLNIVDTVETIGCWLRFICFGKPASLMRPNRDASVDFQDQTSTHGFLFKTSATDPLLVNNNRHVVTNQRVSVSCNHYKTSG
jgi:hypothetical protein